MQDKDKQINIHTTPEMMAGVYANFANVSHSDYEFSITFVRLEHGEADNGEMNGVVVARINMAPKFMKELLEAMQDNLGKWETVEHIKNLPETTEPRPPRSDDTAGGIA